MKRTADTDEKGNSYATPIVEFVACQWCNAAVPKRAKGRPPKFCGPDCRTARQSAQRRVESTYRAWVEAEDALKRGGTATSG